MATLHARLFAAPPRPGGRLSPLRLAAFSSLTLPIYAAQGPLAVYLPAIYAEHYGLPLATIGLIFLLERIWGAAADPLIGFLGDRSGGRRRTWIVTGAAMYAAAGAVLFFPPPGFGASLLATGLFLFYLGWSMIQIPYLAWSGELSDDYHERTRIATYGTVAGSLSLLIVLVLPTIIDQFDPNHAALKLASFGLVVIGGLAITLPLALTAVDDTPRARPAHQHLPLIQTLRMIVQDRLLLRVIMADFAVTAGQLIRSALIVFFVSAYMGRPEWASGLFLFQFVFGVAAGPIWMRIATRLGKHRTAMLGELVQVAINLGLLLVTPARFPLLLALTLAQGLAQGSGNLMLRAIVADIADRHRLETGADRTTLFFSVFSLTSKAGMAAAIGIALPLVAWFGFSPTGPNTPAALDGLLYVFALGPALAHLLSAACLYRFPLDQAEQERVRLALAMRAG
ncbi:MFS transporter [Sphingomonadaceae bacterium jetA1]|jgi:Na+/melibiose symporter-like transporter|uniref:MFS transporter n=1 Tax=Facivitalis istanbulensis TaxID=3075838 RepID=UPI0034974465